MKTPDNNISHYILSCILPVLLLLPLMLFPGCRGSYRDDPRLRNIGTKLSDRSLPSSEALPLLDSLEKIPDTDLSEGERHYRDFLTIKASDKGYVKHTSDSLYLTVKDYFSSHHSREMLPEVLYYGGRVYSDMGNYPIALQYFQEVLDCPSDNPESLSLRGFAASQAGRLLSKLRLHDDALPYVEESMRIDHILADTLSLIYDLELAGHISTSMQAYRAAEKYFEEACRLSEGRYPDESAINRLHIGNVLYKQWDMQRAIPIIRVTVNEADSMRRNYALAVAAQAYLKAGITDTAYIYAHELIHSADPLNKKIGYSVLISGELRGILQPDTLAGCLSDYAEILGKEMDSNMREATLLQHTLYNYSTHDRDRQKAENERDRIKFWLAISIAISVTFALCILLALLLRERRINNIFRLVLKKNYMDSTASTDSTTPPKAPAPDDDPEIEERILTGDFPADTVLEDARENLLQSILNKGANGTELEARLYTLRTTEACQNIFMRVRGGESIEDDDSIWDCLRDAVEEIFPGFLKKLRLLTDGRLTLTDERTALLVKCGFGVEDMRKAFGRSKSAIVSRRREISKKIFGEKKGSKEIVQLIQSL